MRGRLIAAVAVVLLLAGCSGATEGYEDYNFKSLDELGAVVDWDCTLMGDEDATLADLEDLGWASAPCSNGSIQIWESDSKRQEVTSLPQNALQPGHCRLAGGNWSVSGAQIQVKDAQKKLGGELVCA